MKVYTVTKMSKIDYDFSVTTTTHGAFFNFENAVERLKEVVEKFKKSIKDDIEKYSDIETYIDEDNGLYTEYEEIDEKFNDGYWECHFGCEKHYELHCIAIDEFEVEDVDAVIESRSRYRLASYLDSEETEEFYAMLTPSEVEFIEKDLRGEFNASFNIRTEDGQTIEIGIIDAIEKVDDDSKETSSNNDPITLNRALELLNAVIDHISVANTSHDTIRELIDIGFSPSELVEAFNWCSSDVRDVEEEMEEE